MAKEEENIFFVRLENPQDVQRSILECTKSVLSNLKRYESFRTIRKYKIEYLMQLKHIMGEIRLLNNRLRRSLPKTGLRAAVKEIKVQEKPEAKPITSIDKLEDELNDIESKLKDLE